MRRPARAALIALACAAAAIAGSIGTQAVAADGPSAGKAPPVTARSAPRPAPKPAPKPAPHGAPRPAPRPAPKPAPAPDPAGRPAGPGGQVNGIVDDHPSSPEPAEKRLTAAQATAARPQRGATAATVTKTVPVVVQKQATRYFCAPASGRAALSGLLAAKALPTQQSLAKRMGTGPAGTALSRIPPVLNALQTRNAYTYVSGLDLTGYRSRVRGGIDRYGAPQIDPVQMARLPWYAGTGISGGHAVTSYGYLITTKSWTMHVYDPWDGVRHTSVNSAAMYAASLNRDLIW